MVNKIIDGILKAIYNEFGDSYNVYTEQVKQGLQEPCFFINCLNPTNDLFRNNIYKRTNKFCIQYFPSAEEKNLECYDVQERLFNCLENIYVEADLTRGTAMNGEMVNEILNFFVNYDFFTIKQVQEEEKMGELSQINKTKG